MEGLPVKEWEQILRRRIVNREALNSHIAATQALWNDLRTDRHYSASFLIRRVSVLQCTYSTNKFNRSYYSVNI